MSQDPWIGRLRGHKELFYRLLRLYEEKQGALRRYAGFVLNRRDQRLVRRLERHLGELDGNIRRLPRPRCAG